jgi:Legume lectin domain/PEP-CTERM motif
MAQKSMLSMRIHCAALAIAVVACLGSSVAAQFSFSDFSSTAQLNLVQNAARVGNVLRVTPAAQQQNGAAWFATRQSVAGGFSTTFQFQITSRDSVFDGADGFAFLVQNQGATAIGTSGGGLGYNTMPNSLAVEFDTFFIPQTLGDPNGNHLSVHSRGTLANSIDEAFSLGNTGTGLLVNLSDGLVHTARITYAPGSMRVFVDDMVTPALSVGVNLSTLLSLSSGQSYVGFTSATGNGFENHDILNWSFVPVPEPSAFALAALGLIGPVAWWRRKSRGRPR